MLTDENEEDEYEDALKGKCGMLWRADVECCEEQVWNGGMPVEEINMILCIMVTINDNQFLTLLISKAHE